MGSDVQHDDNLCMDTITGAAEVEVEVLAGGPGPGCRGHDRGQRE